MSIDDFQADSVESTRCSAGVWHDRCHVSNYYYDDDDDDDDDDVVVDDDM